MVQWLTDEFDEDGDDDDVDNACILLMYHLEVNLVQKRF